MKKANITLTKIIDRNDERHFYYTVDNKAFKWFFYDLVKAEAFIKSLGERYDYKELVDDLVY